MAWLSKWFQQDRSFPRGWLIPPRVGRWLLLATALGQAGSPLLINVAGTDTDPPVVPAGYTFSVWSVIVLGCVAAAVYGLPRRRADSPAYRAVHLRLSVVQVLFVAWLVASASPAVWLTLPIFVAMLVLTVDALARVLAVTAPGTSAQDRAVRGLLGGVLGIYAGWSTAAVWVNAATLLTDAGVSAAGRAGTTWQSLILAGATGTAILIARRLGAPLPYVATIAWAFVGVVVSAVAAGLPGLTTAAAAGLLLVAGAALLIRSALVPPTAAPPAAP